MFKNTILLPLDSVEAAWQAFTSRPGVAMADLTPDVERLVRMAWNHGTETGARIERERMAEARERR